MKKRGNVEFKASTKASCKFKDHGASAPEQLIAADRSQRSFHRELECLLQSFPAAEFGRYVAIFSVHSYSYEGIH